MQLQIESTTCLNEVKQHAAVKCANRVRENKTYLCYIKQRCANLPRVFPNSMNCSFKRSLLNFSRSAFCTFLAAIESLSSASGFCLLLCMKLVQESFNELILKQHLYFFVIVTRKRTCKEKKNTPLHVQLT